MPEKRLHSSGKLALLSLAVAADVVGIIPLFGGILAIPLVGGLYLIYIMNDIPILGTKPSRWLLTIGTPLIETTLSFIPPLNLFSPLYTIATLLTIRATDSEDTESQEEYSKKEVMASLYARRTPRTARIGAILFAVCTAGLCGGVAHAQFDLAGLRELTLTTTPQAVEQFQTVEARISSYSIELATSDITWTKDGEVIAQGTGLTSVLFQVGGLGSVTMLEVRAQPTFGDALTARAVLRPAQVSLLWEAQTYTPLFYKGKALHSPGSRVSFVAFPTIIDEGGVKKDPDSLVYEWRKNGKLVPSAGGVGKRTIELSNENYLKDLIVAVKVTDKQNKFLARETAIVPVSTPRLLLYEYDPLSGVLTNTAIRDKYRVVTTGTKIVAEPYFTSVVSRDDARLKYSWRLGADVVPALGIIELRPEGVGSGEQSLSVSIQNLDNILQSTSMRTLVSFSSTNTTNTEPF